MADPARLYYVIYKNVAGSIDKASRIFVEEIRGNAHANARVKVLTSNLKADEEEQWWYYMDNGAIKPSRPLHSRKPRRPDNRGPGRGR